MAGFVMDNASFHFSETIDELCRAAGGIQLKLSPYTPTSDPIEELFAEVKQIIRKNWTVWEEGRFDNSSGFLTWCLSIVGERAQSAKGHFRHSGITVEYL